MRRNPSLAALVSVSVLLLFAVVTAVLTRGLMIQAEAGEQKLLIPSPIQYFLQCSMTATAHLD